MLGVGVGLILAALIMLFYAKPTLTKGMIEELARQQGMVYPEEVAFIKD